MCLYPKLINNKKYYANKKNGGVIPHCVDERTKKVPVGCGKCIECRRQKSREWQVRLQEEIRTNQKAKFVTLTFNNESIKTISEKINGLTGYELDNEIATKAVRWFLERWRKKHKVSLRHWLVTEIGHNGTENIHLHGIIWGDQTLEEIEKYWQYGWVWKGKEHQNGNTINYVNEKTVNYLVKYVNKQDNINKEYKPKILTSPGIGQAYENRIDFKKNKYNGTKTIETYTTRTGHKMSLPVYWRNKIYTEEEREQLWLQKLDKKERWIMGERIDIKNGEEEYYNALKHAQRKNKAMGYGSDEINWERRNYENERRMLKIKERIAKAQNGLPTHTTKSGKNRLQGSSYREKKNKM